MGFAICLAIIVFYVLVALIALPRVYASLRDHVQNTYSFYAPNTTARQWAYVISWCWPVGVFIFASMSSTRRVDERIELNKKERKELEKFRAKARIAEEARIAERVRTIEEARFIEETRQVAEQLRRELDDKETESHGR